MNGIAGIVRLDGAPADPAALGRMLDALGPYGEARATWAEGGAAFGLRARPTTPGAPTAPRALPDGSVLTADVRLDDRDATARALGLGMTPEGDGDLLASALLRWGPDAPEHLTGDFACAWWTPADRRLVLARDPFGVRPLYVAHRPGEVLVFASSVAALFAGPGVSDRIDEAHVADVLRGRAGRERTFWADVRRLPGGHVGVLVDGRFAVHPYPCLRPAADAPHDPAACAEALADALDAAVRDRLRTTVPVGVALSGGLDSSSLAVLARDVVRPGLLPAFGGRFATLPPADRRLADEARYQDAVVATGGFAFRPVEAGGAPLFDPAVETALEESVLAFQPGLHDRLFAAARVDGVGVFMDGLDGDSVVSHGGERLAALAHAGAWGALAAELAAFAAPEHARAFAEAHALPVLPRLARAGRLWAAGGGVRWATGWVGHRRAWGALLPPGGAAPRVPLDPAFARRVGPVPPVPPPPADPQVAHRMGLGAPVHQGMLERAAKLAARHGLEGRFPFYDRRVVGLTLAFPSDVKLRDGLPRWVLREAVRGRLPEAVRRRVHKADLTPAFLAGLRAADASAVAPALAAPDGPAGAYVDLGAVRAAHARLRSGAPAPGDAVHVYTAVVLDRLLRRSFR